VQSLNSKGSLNWMYVSRRIRVDNDPEFAGRLLYNWAYLKKVELDFSPPGKETDNASIEALNGRLRQERLNASWFLSMEDIRKVTQRPDQKQGGLHDSHCSRADPVAPGDVQTPSFGDTSDAEPETSLYL
jgi:transposase InsO family protein